MENKKRFTGYTLYLFVVLVGVIVYLTVFFPNQKREMDALDAEYQNLQMQIQMLAPYETKVAELQQQIKEADTRFMADETLKQPVQLANLLCDAAHAGNVTVQSIDVTASEAGETVPLQGGFTGKAYTAQMSVGVAPGGTPADFLAALESNSGAGFYVQNFQYTPSKRTPEQGVDPLAEAAAEAEAAMEAEQKVAEKTAERTAYNEKRRAADKAVQDARIKAAVAAASNNPADAVDAQIAADYASKLKAELADFAGSTPSALKDTSAPIEEMDLFLVNITYYTMEK
ncbi:MAG: hypothetical protein RRY96_02465 [Ruthenibacterium sp.]